MKKLLKALTAGVLALSLAACTSDTIDLSILQILYNQVNTITVTGGDLDEEKNMNAVEIQHFVLAMNELEKVYTVADENDIPTEYLTLTIQKRAGKETVLLAAPYINVSGHWFYVKDENDIYELEMMEDIIYDIVNYEGEEILS